MIPELRESIQKNDGVATLLAPGPSSEIMPEQLHEGTILSVNNIKPNARFQWSADAIDMQSDVAIYLETADDIPRNDAYIVGRLDGHSLTPLFDDGFISSALNNVASGCVCLIMHGATEIRLFGQDGCDPRGENLSRWNAQDGKPRDDHYFDLIASNHARFEKMVNVAIREHGVKFINFSPFAQISGTLRAFDKYGHVNAYKKAMS